MQRNPSTEIDIVNAGKLRNQCDLASVQMHESFRATDFRKIDIGVEADVLRAGRVQSKTMRTQAERHRTWRFQALALWFAEGQLDTAGQGRQAVFINGCRDKIDRRVAECARRVDRYRCIEHIQCCPLLEQSALMQYGRKTTQLKRLKRLGGGVHDGGAPFGKQRGQILAQFLAQLVIEIDQRFVE